MRAYITNLFTSWRRSIQRWLNRHDTAGTDYPPQPTIAPLEIVPAKPRRKIAATLGGLLELVDEAFESAQLPADDWGMTDKRTRLALRRLGPWVPFGSPWSIDDTKTSILPKYLSKFPGIIFMSRGIKDEWADGGECPDGHFGTVAFAYAYRYQKTPWHIENKPGIQYEFGMAYRLKKRLQWISMNIVIDPETGRTDICRALYKDRVYIKSGKNKGFCYSTKKWRTPALEEAGVWGDHMEERERVALSTFASVFEWWQRRSERWSVSVRKGNQRVTWSVEKHLTKDFFKDRDKTVLTPTGQRKKIIHYVSAHSRVRNGKESSVREHIRGLREFEWRGFECAITAPEFHAFSIEKFDIGSVDEDDAEPGVKYVGIETFAKRLAAAEDRQAA